MKCFQCGKEIKYELNMIFINIDEDVVCDKKCQSDYKKEKDYFFREIKHDEKSF